MTVSFPAMENMFRKVSVAKYAYVYMAQPLWQNVPPFCLACFGTDNKFCAEDLLPRWEYITNECTKRGITVLSFGADGDSRLMKCMKISSTFEPSSHSLPTNNISSTIPTIWNNKYSICTRHYPPCCQIEEPFVEAKYCFTDGRLYSNRESLTCLNNKIPERSAWIAIKRH